MESGMIEIRYRVSMIGLSIKGVLTAASGLIVFGWIPFEAGDFYGIAYLALVYFGGRTLVSLWLSAKGPVVTLSGSGIRDGRIANEEILWLAIRTIATWTEYNQQFLVFDVDPSFEAGLSLTRTVRWSRQANRLLGVDGLCLNAKALKIDFSTLKQICEERVRNAHAG
jgi:hypothetical protein